MNTEGILSRAKKHVDFIQQLKKESPYYPNFIFRSDEEGTQYISTLVRIERNGQWYVVHCVESYTMDSISASYMLLNRLTRQAYKIQHLYQLTGKYEELDKLQIPETERLLQLYTV